MLTLWHTNAILPAQLALTAVEKLYRLRLHQGHRSLSWVALALTRMKRKHLKQLRDIHYNIIAPIRNLLLLHTRRHHWGLINRNFRLIVIFLNSVNRRVGPPFVRARKARKVALLVNRVEDNRNVCLRDVFRP